MKGDWGVVLAKNPDNGIEGVLVYHLRKYKGFELILMPPMCFYNGIYYLYPLNMKTHSKLAFEKKVGQKLINALPKVDIYYQQFLPTFKNWLPFYFNNFKQSTRYTYIIDTEADTAILKEQLKGNIRRHIKKSEERCLIHEANFESFWEALNISFTSRKAKNPFQKALLQRLHTNLSNLNACSLQLCVEKDTQTVLGGTFIGYDQLTSYYIAGFYNNVSKEIGGLSYLLWKNITSGQTRYFDFEGSMIEDIEFFFRAFGGRLTPHYRIWKVNNPLLKLLFKIKMPKFLDN